MKYIIQYIILLLVVLQSAYGQQTDSRNYVIVRNYKQAGASPDNVSQVNIQVQYLDGLGRPLQNVSVKQSPDGLDVIQAIEYDAAGRQAKQYLPYVAPSGTGAYKSGALSEVGSWYTANSALLKASDLSRPYVETSFDQSPLNRPSGQRAPGNNSANSSIKYKINVASEIKRYDYNPSTNVIQQAGYYYDGRLTRSQFTDEQGNEVNEYTDKLGKVIAKQVEDAGITYYVYDDRGLLRGVLQPSFQDSGSYTDFAFIYDYDNLDRMISKTIPGSGKTDMVYDNFDRPVLSQDANQLARGVWAFTKYDALNRAVMTGEVTSGNARGTWQTSFNGASAHHEDKQGSGVGYTLSNTLPVISESEILNVTYYDDYSFPGNQAYGHAFSVPANAAVKGQATGSRTRMLNTGTWLVSTIRYDAEYRPIEVVRQLPDLGAAITTERVSTIYKYDLAPVVAQQQTDHLSSATGPIINSHWKVFQYDHADRLLSVTEKVKLGALEKQATTVAHRYNTLGQLQGKWIHSDNLLQFRLRTDYTNNIRGWITDGKTVYKQVGGGPDVPFFGFGLAYTNGSNYTNGNISQMQWNGKDEAAFTKGLSFAYDGADRLTGSTGLSGYGDTESGITYDKNGNIKTLVRAGAAVDNLVYTYAGNRLTGINDATGSNKGVKGGVSTYGYDANGNMTSDGNRGAVLTYNYLNLPKTVAIAGKTLTYDYDASGTKHKYVADTLTVKYEGGFEYNAANAFKRLALFEGQAVLKNNAIVFEYYLKDHLDNVRVVFSEKGDVLQKSDFYPFGLSIDRNSPIQPQNARNGINRNLFNGKELQVGSGYLDYGARMYMPEIGRWGVADALAEKWSTVSPYTYTLNNPMNLIDPDGNSVTDLGDRIQYDGADIAPLAQQLGIGSGSTQENDDEKKAAKNKSQNNTRNVLTIDQVDPMILAKTGQSVQKGTGNLAEQSVFLVGLALDIASFGGAEFIPKGLLAKWLPKSWLKKGLERGLSNAEVRLWYNKQLQTLNTAVDFTEENAALLHSQRNALKTEARSMMADRQAAAMLEKTDPLRSFNFYVDKYSKQGFSGEGLWQRIIKGSSTPNAGVNSKFGIK